MAWTRNQVSKMSRSHLHCRVTIDCERKFGMTDHLSANANETQKSSQEISILSLPISIFSFCLFSFLSSSQLYFLFLFTFYYPSFFVFMVFLSRSTVSTLIDCNSWRFWMPLPISDAHACRLYSKGIRTRIRLSKTHRSYVCLFKVNNDREHLEQ